ncbi:MAG: hypothetical protein Q8P30_00585 [Candidatus Uhrbacteria bacterium]|nr:hypothetical protein [Candidatus Uhrbacteria bacterium]
MQEATLLTLVMLVHDTETEQAETKSETGQLVYIRKPDFKLLLQFVEKGMIYKNAPGLSEGILDFLESHKESCKTYTDRQSVAHRWTTDNFELGAQCPIWRKSF